MSDLKDDLIKINSKWDSLKDDMMEFAQGPSDFQIEVFMALGEGPPDLLPVHAYRHMLAQIRPTISEMRRLKIAELRLCKKIKGIREEIQKTIDVSKIEDLELDLMEVEFEMEDLKISLKGKEQQYESMNRVLTHIKSSGVPLTNEQLQKDEWKYWTIRLSKQAVNNAEGNSSGIGSGNLNSLKNAIEGSPLPNSPHRIPQIPNDPRVLRGLAAGDERLLELVHGQKWEEVKSLLGPEPSNAPQ